MGILETITGPKRWEPTPATMPLSTRASDLKPLGVDYAGRAWFRFKTYEMYEMATIEEARQPLPNGVIVDVGDGRWRTFGPPQAPGTYEGLMRGWASRRQPKPEAPPRLIDLVAATDIGWRGPLRGADGIRASLRWAGATVIWTGERTAVYLSRKGYAVASVLELFRAGERILEADYRGQPLACELGRHRKSVRADTIALGGMGVCADCLKAGYLEKPA